MYHQTLTRAPRSSRSCCHDTPRNAGGVSRRLEFRIQDAVGR
jgi:hypothetical protein